MERLTEYIAGFAELKNLKATYCGEVCELHAKCDTCPILKAIHKLAKYEDLEEQGKLIELPCAVGDTVYEISGKKILEYTLKNKWRIARYVEAGLFCVKVFLTREEAEQKLMNC